MSEKHMIESLRAEIAELRKIRKEAERIVWALIQSSGGEVRIDDAFLEDFSDYAELRSFRDEARMQLVLQARIREPRVHIMKPDAKVLVGIVP